MISKVITRNFLSLFLSNVIGQLFTLWAFVQIARVFGPEGFGKFSFAQVVGLHFLFLADFGLQTLGTRTIAQEKGDITRHVKNITQLRILLATGCFLLLVIFSLLLPKPGDVQFLIIIFGVALFPSAVLLEWVFLGIEKMEFVGLGRILKGIVFAGLVFIFITSPEHLSEAAVFYVAGIVAASGILLAVYSRKFGFPSGTVEHPVMKSTLIAAVPLAAGSLIAQVNFNFGIIALGFFLPDEAVGLYSAAYKLVLFMLAFAVVAAANAVFPLMAKTYKRSVTLFGDSLKKLLRLFVIIAIPVGIGGCILASQIMGFLYSPEYQKAAIVFQLSIWIVVIAIYRVIFENALIASKNQRNYFVGYVLAGASTILGNLSLAPTLGIITPSIVGIFSESLLLVYFVSSCKYMRLSYILKSTLKPLLAGLLMGLALILLPMNLFAAVGFGIVVYCALLVVFRSLTLEEVAGYVRAVVE